MSGPSLPGCLFSFRLFVLFTTFWCSFDLNAKRKQTKNAVEVRPCIYIYIHVYIYSLLTLYLSLSLYIWMLSSHVLFLSVALFVSPAPVRKQPGPKTAGKGPGPSFQYLSNLLPTSFQPLSILFPICTCACVFETACSV